ncbi:ankyrin repeat domain-containing protein [Cardinium endosymbiont of Bemisia tabaci]|uniref:ankyrin repeat domain-containing protein n=1 Tax=Cardinium endosymbiont of Bemisia tabaci TaxID=672794 RepID=UPI000442D256|nr:ankyrin repeat domain-containing protein [Cardinium endosymbiont of Bemisia tabaci]CDG49686.1 Ankyrin repeats-containing protein [Cardinium endosymbiont cBtQ1 of Bemisia tabaci]
MNKNLKQFSHIKHSNSLLKRVTTFSFLAALQLSSCISGQRQGFTDLNKPRSIDYLLLDAYRDVDTFKQLQCKTRDTLFQHAPDLNGRNALRNAISKGDLVSVKSLLHGKSIDPNALGNGLTSLVWALKCKHEKIFYFLLAHQDIDITTADRETGMTPLHLAIINGWIPGVRALVAHLLQEDLLVKDNRGRTPLDLTMLDGRKDLLMLLVDIFPAQALRAKDENGMTLLHICMRRQLIDATARLIHKLPNEDLYQKDKIGMTPLHVAVKYLPKDILLLLVNKLPVEALASQDNKGRTPLHLAARIKKKNGFKLLLDQIVDRSGRDQAVAALFKANNKGYSVFQCSYLPKHRDFSALWHNSKVQIPTVSIQEKQMFKYMLETLPSCLTIQQLATIVREIDEVEDSCVISKQLGAKLRGMVRDSINKQRYGSEVDKIRRQVAQARSRNV